MGLSHHLQKRLLWFLKYGEQNNIWIPTLLVESSGKHFLVQ